jgi:hypothetical protein
MKGVVFPVRHGCLSVNLRLVATRDDPASQRMNMPTHSVEAGTDRIEGVGMAALENIRF